MTDKLQLYNLALGTYIGTQTLANLNENVATRHALDRVYEGALLYVLEQGLWKFALKTVELTGVRADALAHRQYVYPLPPDFVRLARISPDKRLDTHAQLEDFMEENGAIYTDSNRLWLQYVSKAETHGLNLDLYPAKYEQAVAGLPFTFEEPTG